MKRLAPICLSLLLCHAFKLHDITGSSQSSWLDRVKLSPEGPRHFARKPGGTAVTLTEKELLRDGQARHASCDFPVLDAKAPDFLEKLHNLSFRPLLIINGVGDWKVQDWSSESWVQNGGVQENKDYVYRWLMDRRANIAMPWGDKVHDYYKVWNQIGGARADGAVDFVKDNGVIWSKQPAFKQMYPENRMPTPSFLPEPDVNSLARFMSYHAHGTSNGFHKHPTTQWLTELNGFKSWYFMPPETLTYPKDYTSHGSQEDFGFWHEPSLQNSNTVCGYRPENELMKRHLQTCTAGPGEIVIVPRQWWHATCALGEFLVGTGGAAPPATAQGPYRTFPQEDHRQDDFMTLRKYYLSILQARRPQEAMAEKMAKLLLQSQMGSNWKSIVFRVWETAPNPRVKSVFFYNDSPYPLELYAKQVSGAASTHATSEGVSVASIAPYGVVGQRTDTSWSFSTKRADGSGVQRFSVVPGEGEAVHVVFGEDTVVSYMGSDVVIPELQAWDSERTMNIV
mmetsp:Transcript_89728/g.159484  ORF Transcript_89728/g.159484 Transcript_89728/m.159484 type:complete len:510 (-) Transcript_89728:37-1566(-)